MRFFNLFTPAQAKIIKKSQVDVALCGRSERPQNRADAAPCLSDVYNIGTRAKRRLADVRLSGRSMVEMLGVLAIIGVLSIGAIAGYSKAMFKYKLNRQAEQLNTVFNAAARYYPNFKYPTSQRLTPYFIKLGEIPVEMIRKNTTSIIYDIFNTSLYINYDNVTGSNGFLVIYIFPELEKDSVESLEICRNIITTAKENSNSIRMISTVSGYGTDEEKSSHLYGDAYCSSSRRCLKNLSLDDVYDLCRTHIDKEGAHLKVYWPAV